MNIKEASALYFSYVEHTKKLCRIPILTARNNQRQDINIAAVAAANRLTGLTWVLLKITSDVSPNFRITSSQPVKLTSTSNFLRVADRMVNERVSST